MRLKRSELKELYFRKRTVTKDAEGGTEETFGQPELFKGILWPAGGKVQAAMYGEKLPYMFNIKVDGKYGYRRVDGRLQYVLENGIAIMELDGVSLSAEPADTGQPDYQIIAIRPYEHLQLEVEQIDRRNG